MSKKQSPPKPILVERQSPTFDLTDIPFLLTALDKAMHEQRYYAERIPDADEGFIQRCGKILSGVIAGLTQVDRDMIAQAHPHLKNMMENWESILGAP